MNKSSLLEITQDSADIERRFLLSVTVRYFQHRLEIDESWFENDRVIAEDQSGYSSSVASRTACVPQARSISGNVQSCFQEGCGSFANFSSCWEKLVVGQGTKLPLSEFME
jgi:hypothetical protein